MTIHVLWTKPPAIEQVPYSMVGPSARPISSLPGNKTEKKKKITELCFKQVNFHLFRKLFGQNIYVN